VEHLMVLLLFFVLVSSGFVVAIFSLLARKSRPDAAVLSVTELLPEHYREFGVLTTHLAHYDDLLRKVQIARREAALTYLDRLQKDFSRVERLLNHATKFIPDISPANELKRFARGIWFRLELRTLRIAVQLGFMPFAQFRAATREIARLAEWAESVLAEVASHPGLPNLRADLNGP
jgi:hypothetical protein